MLSGTAQKRGFPVLLQSIKSNQEDFQIDTHRLGTLEILVRRTGSIVLISVAVIYRLSENRIFLAVYKSMLI